MPLSRTGRLVRRTRLRSGGALRRRSKKQAKSQRELDSLKPALMERSGGRCEARFSKYCTGVGTQPHHVVKQSQARRQHDLELIKWVCFACNAEVEMRPNDAEAAGLLIRSWNDPRRTAPGDDFRAVGW